MNHTAKTLLFCALTVILPLAAFGQAENVPADHPVYVFLKRMEVKGVIERYHDAIIPLSRREVAEFLAWIARNNDRLTSAERGWLADYRSEFQYDITGSIAGFNSLVGSSNDSVSTGFDAFLAPKEKFGYAFADSNLSFFVNGLLTFDARRITGDALGSKHAEFIQGGGRIRGTIYSKLGYYLQATNAQFWGSRELLERDNAINQTHTIRALDAQNFDMVDGYVRYDDGIVSAQVGTERILWGNGYDQQMIVSDNSRQFPFLRADFQYKSLKYSFMHGWILGHTSGLIFSDPSDTTVKYYEPIAADKYIAAHRIEFSFSHLFDIGGQEMVIYSNRSPDLAYLNPVTLIESAQRNRGERDNVLWSFDVQTHFLDGLELQGTLLFDDLHFAEFFKPRWYNRYAYQTGFFLTDPLFLPNMSLMVEYTRVEPYVFAHDRSRDDSYTNLGMSIGPRIGPNADSWFVRVDVLPSRNLMLSGRVTLERHGENVVDANGNLVKNVGGDIDQGHRTIDPVDKVFLDGTMMKTTRIQLSASYQFVNQLWLVGWYEFESIKNETSGTTVKNSTVVTRLRMEF